MKVDVVVSGGLSYCTADFTCENTHAIVSLGLRDIVAWLGIFSCLVIVKTRARESKEEEKDIRRVRVGYCLKLWI